MKDLSTVSYNPTSEAIVQVLCEKTQNTSPLFFRILTSYYLCKMAATMRADIQTHDRGKIPVNCYALNLAVSGFGKGYSTNIMEEQIINQFQEIFMEETLPQVAEENLNKLAVRRATRNSTEPELELAHVVAEYNRLGALVFSFDSGTSPAVKQMRHKLLMAGAGAVNLEIDEIGSNLLSNTEVLHTFLELFDVGKIKQKLTKNTAENVRSEQIEGRTPTNMMLFGTQAKLLNGGKEEDEFNSLLEIGFARRCLFGYSRKDNGRAMLTPEELYDVLTSSNSSQVLENLSNQFATLASYTNFNRTIDISRDVTIEILGYQQDCEKQTLELSEHEETRKAELRHRYFKALKLAGAYAFVENEPEITTDHWWAAVKLVEDSGEAFNNILTRDRNYAKLAKYMANIKGQVTHVDLVEDLPFYRGSGAAKRELMELATAYGYKHNIIIKKHIQGNIEFFQGESLEATDLSQIRIAYSTDFACGYMGETVPFDQLHQLTQADGYHWVNHHCEAGDSCGCVGHRKEDHMIAGFNMIVIDVDGTCPMPMARNLMKDYTYMMYTTKRHTEDEHRYRILLPISHFLKLDAKDYKQFMNNIFEWLPFESDESTGQRSKKWLSHDGNYEYNEGQLLDALMFIPNTSKNDERKQQIDSLASLSNVERWFLTNSGEGSRNNQLLKFAMLLVDSGFSFDEIKSRTLGLNSKLDDPLDELEIHSSILITVAKALQGK